MPSVRALLGHQTFAPQQEAFALGCPHPDKSRVMHLEIERLLDQKEVNTMNARHKLNCAYFIGSVLCAGATGLVLQSWSVFFLALLLLVGSNLYLGEIRPGGRQRRGD